MHKIFKVGMLSFLVSIAASAATITFDFTTSGGTVGGNPATYGDTRTYWDATHTYSVTASSYSLPANLLGNFSTAQLNQYSGLGLASCNQTEGAGCGDPVHQVDNQTSFDFVLFKFNFTADPTSVVINPYGTYDRDVTYWVGDNNTALTGLNLAGLGMGARMDDDSTVSTNSRSVSIGGGTGNALLLGARLSGNNADSNYDYFKIESLTASSGGSSSVPEPATFGLAGMALVGLGLIRRRRGTKS